MHAFIDHQANVRLRMSRLQIAHDRYRRVGLLMNAEQDLDLAGIVLPALGLQGFGQPVIGAVQGL
jgi:hypothetical protein